MTEHITMQHGSGGSATAKLIETVFAAAFQSELVSDMEDAALLPLTLQEGERLAMTTDSFVVTPLFFPGGDIGRLSVCGTVNDLLSRGAVPKYLTCGFVIEEGAAVPRLRDIAQSMAKTAAEAGVTIAAGDTKVIEGSGGVIINTAGLGVIPAGTEISAKNAAPGDRILVTGNLGDHHAALLSTRMAVETSIESDAAPLCGIVDSLRDLPLHTLRDVTRGGLATVLKELAEASGMTFVLKEEYLPVSTAVRDFSGILGLDPLYMGNEGKMAVILPKEAAAEALHRIKAAPYGAEAGIIGRVCAPKTPKGRGALYMETAIGGTRVLSVLQGEGLPRIC